MGKRKKATPNYDVVNSLARGRHGPPRSKGRLYRRHYLQAYAYVAALIHKDKSGAPAPKRPIAPPLHTP